MAAYCDSDLARRVAGLEGVEKERHFTFEHDGVLVHGFIDAFHLRDGRALVVDYKTNALGEASPDEIVEEDYRLQRLVYALACFRAGAEEVEVVYHFLERPDAPVEAVFTPPTCPSSRPSSPPRSPASRRASSRRRRATSPARAARRSISSAQARACARGFPKPLPRSYLQEARKRVGPKKQRIGRSSSGSRPSTPTPRSRSASAARSSCSSR